MIAVSRILGVLMAAACVMPMAQSQQSVPAGQISGFVTTTDNPPVAVRRAIVSLVDSSQHVEFHTIGDDQGRFTLSQLPKGRYTLQAARPAFVPIAYGASEPGRSGSTIPLEENQVVTDLRVQVARGAAISGAVRDTVGEPLSGLIVRAQWAGGPGLNLEVPPLAVTDDQGEFRVYGLAAGPYVVFVEPHSTTPRSMEVPTDAEVDAAFRELQRQFSGVPTPPVPGNLPPRPPSPLKYEVVSVYFPTALSRADASTVSVEAGQDRRGIDIIVRLR